MLCECVRASVRQFANTMEFYAQSITFSLQISPLLQLVLSLLIQINGKCKCIHSRLGRHSTQPIHGQVLGANRYRI